MKIGLPTGTLTLPFTDVEGSTRMAPDVDAHCYAEALKEHHRLVRDAVAAQGRRGAQGDALCVFTFTREAVACAQDAQDASLRRRFACGWAFTPARRSLDVKALSPTFWGIEFMDLPHPAAEPDMSHDLLGAAESFKYPRDALGVGGGGKPAEVVRACRPSSWHPLSSGPESSGACQTLAERGRCWSF